MGVIVETKFHTFPHPFSRVLVRKRAALRSTVAVCRCIKHRWLLHFFFFFFSFVSSSFLSFLFCFYERVHIMLAHDVTTALVKVSSCGLLLLRAQPFTIHAATTRCTIVLFFFYITIIIIIILLFCFFVLVFFFSLFFSFFFFLSFSENAQRFFLILCRCCCCLGHHENSSSPDERGFFCTL